MDKPASVSKDIRRRDTPESRAFWDSVEDAALWVNAHHLCFSNMCVVNGGPCDSPNAKDRKVAREMAELKAQKR